MAARPSRHYIEGQATVDDKDQTRWQIGGRPQVSDSLRRHCKTTLDFDPDVVGNAAEACPQLVRALEFVPHVMRCRSSPLAGKQSLVPRLTAVLILIKCTVVLHEHARPRQGARLQLGEHVLHRRLPGERRELAKFHVVSRRQRRPYQLLPMAAHGGRDAPVRPV